MGDRMKQMAVILVLLGLWGVVAVLCVVTLFMELFVSYPEDMDSLDL
jgi:hypothetical protein